MKRKAAVIGSGNWGTTVAKLIAENLKFKDELSDYESELKMYVYEEILPDGQKLSDFINKYRQNIKYLPGIVLPVNISAEPDLAKAIKDATDIILVSPHQFAAKLLSGIAEFIKEFLILIIR